VQELDYQERNSGFLKGTESCQHVSLINIRPLTLAGTGITRAVTVEVIMRVLVPDGADNIYVSWVWERHDFVRHVPMSLGPVSPKGCPEEAPAGAADGDEEVPGLDSPLMGDRADFRSVGLGAVPALPIEVTWAAGINVVAMIDDWEIEPDPKVTPPSGWDATDPGIWRGPPEAASNWGFEGVEPVEAGAYSPAGEDREWPLDDVESEDEAITPDREDDA
jgi:hypothetical protein